MLKKKIDRDELVKTFIQVKLPEENNFLKIKETLSRIGVASKREKKLFQSCHILHKKGSYYIVHFKELFMLDGQDIEMNKEDILRRNTIAYLLEGWELLNIVSPPNLETTSLANIKIVPFKDKHEWDFEVKYTMGTRKKNEKRNKF